MSAVHQLEVLPQPVVRRHLRALPDVPDRGRPVLARGRMARRRFAALLVLLVVVGGAFLAGRAFAVDDAGGSDAVTVRQGDTLSALASRAYPNVPTAQGVAKLQQANNLSSVHIDVGQKLVTPR